MDPRTVITESGYIKSRFLDDKLSAAILLGLAHAVKEDELNLNRKVSLLFTVYEEVGHGGSFVSEDTEEMISVDMGCVGADLVCTERMVSICAKDSGGPYNYDLVTALSAVAKEQHLGYAIDVYPHYGSDVQRHRRRPETNQSNPTGDIPSLGDSCKIIERKTYFVVYYKEGEQLVDLLNIMSAHKALLEFENLRVIKEVRNNINRKVNCETANLNKIVSASVRQSEAIEYIKNTVGLDFLPDNLRTMAIARLKNPDASLKVLGELIDPPIGKSGVNHRLNKICEMASELKGEMQNE